MSNILLTLFSVGVLGFWFYKLITYDWSNFDEDQKRAMED